LKSTLKQRVLDFIRQRKQAHVDEIATYFEIDQKNIRSSVAHLLKEDAIEWVSKGVYCSPKRKSLPKLIIDYLIMNGPSTTDQVRSGMGQNIDPSWAALTGRREERISKHKVTDIVDRGTKRLVTDALGRLARAGAIAKVGSGIHTVYSILIAS
jgi:hypothetical protein